MKTLLLQTGPPPSGEPGLLLLAIIPVILILTGMVLGFRALRDIRLSNGTLGGAVLATFAAGLLPAMFIVAGCIVPLTLLGQKLSEGRLNVGVLLLPGIGVGMWLSFLMMRGMHRAATGWTPPAPITPAVPGLSRLATAAIVLTIAGAAVMLLSLVLPAERLPFGIGSRQGVMLLDLPVLIAGLICGVLSYRETAGKTCAWISGSLFAVLLLLFAA